MAPQESQHQALCRPLHGCVLERTTDNGTQSSRIRASEHRARGVLREEMEQRVIRRGDGSSQAGLLWSPGFLPDKELGLGKQIGWQAQEAVLSSFSFRNRTKTQSDTPL
jgi:hypothetical protein